MKNENMKNENMKNENMKNDNIEKNMVNKYVCHFSPYSFILHLNTSTTLNYDSVTSKFSNTS